MIKKSLEMQLIKTSNIFHRVPLAIVNKAHQANQLYPFAISLIESVRTYERTLEKVSYSRFRPYFFLTEHFLQSHWPLIYYESSGF